MQEHEPKMTAHSSHLYIEYVIWCQIWAHNSAANLELQEEEKSTCSSGLPCHPLPQRCK